MGQESHITQLRIKTMVARLKEHGCRMTPQRLAIVRILAESPDHPTAEEIHRRVYRDFPMTSLATVYKTLAVLKELGEVQEMGFGDHGSRFDGLRPHAHPHVICTRCGEILDPELADMEILAGRMAEQTGYRITFQRMDFFGVCPRCQKT